MTRLLIDPAADFDDPGAVTITATLLDPGPSVVRTFADVTTDTVVDLPAPDTTEAWRLTIRRPVTIINRWNIPSTNPGLIVAERTVHFPDGDPIAWAALTDVDPGTLRTTAVPSAAWAAAIAELRAEVDALPTGGGGGGFSGAYADLTGKPPIPSTPADIGAATPADITAAIDALDLEALSTGSAVRVSAGTLPTWARKLQLSLLDQAPARVLCIGDSTTAGVYSDSYSTATGNTNQGGPNSYPARLAADLTAHGIPAIYAMGIPGRVGNEDSRWAVGTASYAGGVGAGASAAIYLDAGQVSTFTPGIKADTYRVYFYSDGGTGHFTAQATGGTATDVDTSSHGDPAQIKSATITAGSASAGNVVTMTGVSICFVVGVEYWDSGNPNVVRILPAGVGQSQANDWANATNSTTYGGRAFVKGIGADLTVVSLGINDAYAGRTAAQITADVATLAGEAQHSGDVLILSAIPQTGGATEAVNAAYLGGTLPYVDLQDRYGRDMQARGLMTTDGVHPNALGYSDIAGVVGRALASVTDARSAASTAPAAAYVNAECTAWTPSAPASFSTVPLSPTSSSHPAQWVAGGAPGWTVPVTGLYSITGSVRITDGYPVAGAANVGVGADSTVTDTPRFTWHPVTPAMRHTFALARTQRFAAGDVVRLYTYVDGGPGTFSAAAMSLALLSPG